MTKKRNTSHPLYAIHNLVKTRQQGGGYALLIRRLTIAQGALLAITGPSGCGKSTTLDIIGLGLAPDSADLFQLRPAPNSSIDIAALWRSGKLDDLADLRRRGMGYVLQSGELLPYLSTGENICLMARLKNLPKEEIEETARSLAHILGIASLWDAMPATLSVGERQRAAIARALAARPAVIIADEPTAALDPMHAEKVMEIFLDCVGRFGSALILATHNAAWAQAGGLTEIPFHLERTEDGVTAILDHGARI